MSSEESDHETEATDENHSSDHQGTTGDDDSGSDNQKGTDGDEDEVAAYGLAYEICHGHKK